jgi:retron-type reverse transcriptase
MTAAMLVLEPVFEADLPPEQYAYRPGRNAHQAVAEVGELLFRGHPEIVDADLADYFGTPFQFRNATSVHKPHGRASGG